MDKIKVVVVEDEAFASRRIVRLLEENGVEVISVIASVEEGIEWFENNTAPDLVVSDIQLGDGLSFSIYQAINLQCHIIFTTAYNQYALNAFKHNSVDYLLKPIDEEDLKKSIEKFKNYFQHQENKELDLSALKQALFPDKQYKKRFLVKVGQFLKPVDITDVECIYSEHKLTYFHLTNGKNIPVDDTLEKLGEEIDPSLFFRVNRKYLIAKQSVSEIVAYSNSRLKILLNSYRSEEIIVAREKVKQFKNWMTE